MINHLKKIFEILPKSDKWKIFGLFLLMLIGALMEVIGISLVPIFLSTLSNPEFILNNNSLSSIFLFFGIKSNIELLIFGGLALVLVFFIKGLYLIWLNYIKSKFVYNRFSFISNKLFETYTSAPYEFHLTRNSAELTRNITTETIYIANQLLIPFISILMQGVTVVGIFVLLVIVEPVITLVTYAVLGGSGTILLTIIKKKMRMYGKNASLERSRMIQGVNEGIGGIKDIKVMNRQKLFVNRFKQFVKNLSRAEVFKQTSAQASKPTIEFIAISGIIFIAFLMIYQGRDIKTVIPILTLFGAATVRLMPSVNQILSQLTNMKYYSDSLTQVHNDIQSNSKHTESQRFLNNTNEKLKFDESIKLVNVSYNYPNSPERALNNINIEIIKGSVVGFIGESGSGKSTIVDVILGLLSPQYGGIFVDGQDISINMRLWQNNIGYIPQFIYLTDDTIKNNIAFGISEDEIDNTKLFSAIKAAQLDVLISELPNGVNTIIGERGQLLSGGQRQRIGIARALYHQPEILIMDEATSALDNNTEKLVIESIETLKGDRTIIMIAHRLTTVKNCDVIYLMNKGRIIDQGTYNEVTKKENNHILKSMV